MTTVPLADEQHSKREAGAAAASFGDVASFVVSIAERGVVAIAERGIAAYEFATIECELRGNAQRCDEANARIENGQGRDAIAAMQELGRKFGFGRRS